MTRFSSNLSIYIGIVVSVALGLQLANHIMSSGVGTELTFTEFFTIPANIFYILLRVCLCMSYWIMNGENNRAYLLCWILGDLLGALIFWNGLQLFLFEQKNIYVLNLLALSSIIPLYLFCRYRLLLLFSLYTCLHKIGLFNRWVLKQQRKLKITKVSTHLDRWLTLLVVIELFFAALFTLFSLYFSLSPEESLDHHLQDNNWPNFFDYHLTVLDIWTFASSILLIKLALDDRKYPDSFVPVSSSVKKRVIDKYNKK